MFGSFTAVNKVSFSVRRGECFGLLGVNGAGKTTTFCMLTGEHVPTMGRAILRGCDLRTKRSEYLTQVGYCPQFDAIIDLLTGREMLHLIAGIRGVPQNVMATEVKKWLHILGLDEYADRYCGTYSGGNKRKLSTAMALIGDPPVVFLDEPTSGVDPAARRNLWEVLAQIRGSGQSIVLTSHSMDECEALCNRLAVMTRGQFRCLGGIQYLKQKYGKGYTVLMKLSARESKSDDDVAKLKEAFEEIFPNAEIKDEHTGLLHYHVPHREALWGRLFHSMESLKHHNVLVEDYSICQTTLEQVFLSFAREEALGQKDFISLKL